MRKSGPTWERVTRRKELKRKTQHEHFQAQTRPFLHGASGGETWKERSTQTTPTFLEFHVLFGGASGAVSTALQVKRTDRERCKNYTYKHKTRQLLIKVS